MFEDYMLDWGLLLPPTLAVFGVLISYTRKKKRFSLSKKQSPESEL
jgi:hypothetical protein